MLNSLMGLPVKDSVTGFTGTVTSITRFLVGEERAGVESVCGKDGSKAKTVYFDVERLVEVLEPTEEDCENVDEEKAEEKADE